MIRRLACNGAAPRLCVLRGLSQRSPRLNKTADPDQKTEDFSNAQIAMMQKNREGNYRRLPCDERAATRSNIF